MPPLPPAPPDVVALSVATVVGHLLHYGLLVAGFAAVGALVLASAPKPARTVPRATTWTVAALGSAGAAGVHAAMVPPHLAESVALGALFVAAAAAQLGWAVLAVVHRGHRAVVLVTGVGLQALALGAWVLSRTSGLPLGLTTGPEAVGAWDLAAVTCQLVAVGACARLLVGALPALDQRGPVPAGGA